MYGESTTGSKGKVRCVCSSWERTAGGTNRRGHRPAADSFELFLIGNEHGTGSGMLRTELPRAGQTSSSFRSDPSDPVSDPYGEFGPHDYSALASRHDLVIFDSEPLANDLEVTGAMTAEIYFSCDCRDLDLWVKVLDVRPDGTAHNLMSPGLDVQRASYRAPDKGRQLLESGEIYRLQFPHLITSNLFRQGHRIRVQISGAFFPHFSRICNPASSSRARPRCCPPRSASITGPASYRD